MPARSIRPHLPPQLRDLGAKAQDLPVSVRDALETTLLSASADATPEQVVADTFARLGYLPGEATEAARKLLGSSSTGSSRSGSV